MLAIKKIDILHNGTIIKSFPNNCDVQHQQTLFESPNATMKQGAKLLFIFLLLFKYSVT